MKAWPTFPAKFMLHRHVPHFQQNLSRLLSHHMQWRGVTIGITFMVCTTCVTTRFCCLFQGGTMAQSHRYKGNVDHINFSSRQGDTCKDPDTKGGLHIYLVSKFATNMQLGLRDWELICDLRGHAICKHYSLQTHSHSSVQVRFCQMANSCTQRNS